MIRTLDHERPERLAALFGITSGALPVSNLRFSTYGVSRRQAWYVIWNDKMIQKETKNRVKAFQILLFGGVVGLLIDKLHATHK